MGNWLHVLPSHAALGEPQDVSGATLTNKEQRNENYGNNDNGNNHDFWGVPFQLRTCRPRLIIVIIIIIMMMIIGTTILIIIITVIIIIIIITANHQTK